MSGEENLANAICDFLLSETSLSQQYDRPFFGKIGSPIEKLFYESIYFGCALNVSWFNLTLGTAKENDDLQLEMQVVILDWPVDFVFTVVSDHGPVSKLVVECDGHDFHERTKDQAARDRSRDRRLQEAGYEVYRYTGSEIYRNSFTCARQVFMWAEKAAWKKAGE